MNRNERITLLIIIILLLLGLLLWRFGPGRNATPENPSTAGTGLTTTSTSTVTISGVDYSQTSAKAGTTFGFRIKGSGFTSDLLHEMSVDSGNKDVVIKNLRLVSGDEIDGDIEVGSGAKSGLSTLRIRIPGSSLFEAPNHFSIRGEGKFGMAANANVGASTSTVQTTATGAPLPPKLELHKELIPKNIEIVRCYYSQDVVPPDTTFGFDVNGSGFTSEFEKMIKVESGQENVRIKNFHLITTNQIHGDMVVRTEAKTGFVYPRVLIKGLPVFSAPEPFAVVRKGEVLTVFFTSMEENGRGGRFRVITNLDDKLEKTFQIVPSTPGIRVSELKPQLPFVMDGHLQIEPGVPPGDHGLTIFIEGQQKYSRMGMIRIVHPNVGQSGFIQGLTAEDKFHRPGDEIQIYVQATGLSSQDTSGLTAKVEEFDVGKATFTYLSPLQLRLTFNSPANTPPGSYSVQVSNNTGQVLYEKKDLFKIVPANWVAGVQVTPPVKAGGRSTLKILGRDFSNDFAAAFQIGVDEPRITVSGLKRLDNSTLTAEIAVSTGVAPGDYWLHLSDHDHKIEPQYPSIIKVEAGL